VLVPSEPEVEDREAGRFPERAALRSVVEGLTRAQRAVVVLHLHAGYSVDETAELLGVPRETVRSRLRVARDRLRRALGEGE
jgi:RNA polymerase sigma-70 factor, ECF subfamily